MLAEAVAEELEEAREVVAEELAEEARRDARGVKPSVPRRSTSRSTSCPRACDSARLDSDEYVGCRYAIDDGGRRVRTDAQGEEDEEEDGRSSAPIATAAIDLASGARYRATGKRKTAIARVTLRPGTRHLPDQRADARGALPAR